MIARMSRRRSEPVRDNYSALVAGRLRELRDSRRWTMQMFLDKLAEIGVNVSQAQAYAYEKGRSHGPAGADLPVELYPAIAEIYGFRTPAGWLPADWPEAVPQPVKSAR